MYCSGQEEDPEEEEVFHHNLFFDTFCILFDIFSGWVICNTYSIFNDHMYNMYNCCVNHNFKETINF